MFVSKNEFRHGKNSIVNYYASIFSLLYLVKTMKQEFSTFIFIFHLKSHFSRIIRIISYALKDDLLFLFSVPLILNLNFHQEIDKDFYSWFLISVSFMNWLKQN
ncbi:hypothetical protein BpHYR1_023630 [Brachionus plicatilis]|uniref:Uncharacterized protein n=1 Tax=Brachionus plicatilis TaxID=10195 RepID=A0A3M7PLD6_BRAPC|nr:hypothetical protein BpHYR1_023630 [Brachionus plicatilis]